MNLNISPEWLLKMAEKEDNEIVSVGGLILRIKDANVPVFKPVLSEVAYKAGLISAMGEQQNVLICENWYIWRIYPDGKKEVVKRLEKKDG